MGRVSAPRFRYVPLPGRWVVPALICGLLLLPPRGAGAQQRPSPFETIDLTFTLLTDIHQGTLHRDWSPGPAIGIGAALPFYLGTVETGVQYAHPTARRGDVPGFRSLFLYAGWSGTRALGPELRAEAGLRAGLMVLRFDGDTLPAFRRRESEPGVAARGALRWAPGGGWFAEAAAAWQGVFTEPRIEQIFLSAGVGRRFRTPAWLRDFLD